jgi:hypothetical protein
MKRLQEVLNGLFLRPEIAQQLDRIRGKSRALLKHKFINGGMARARVLFTHRPIMSGFSMNCASVPSVAKGGFSGRYAASLQELGPPASGPATPAASDLIGNDLSGAEKGQYKYTLTANAGGYVITAMPANPSGGSRTFYSDQSMVIHQNFGAEAATASSPEMK